VASFTVACDQALTCSFDSSASHDPDGSPLSISLEFGDGRSWGPGSGSFATLQHTYDRPGTYTATLRISDGAYETTTSRTVVVPTPIMHVGDLDRIVTSQLDPRSVVVLMAVHASKHAPLGNAVVSASWHDGTTTICITNLKGECTVLRYFPGSKPPASLTVSLTVTGVTREYYAYTPAANHDPDADSNGSTISVVIPKR
jgi:hypothetical protein